VSLSAGGSTDAGRRPKEAIWLAAELRAGGAYAHSILALEIASHHHGPRAA
jgi:hypothetical protein